MALRTLALLLLLCGVVSAAAAADFSLQPRLCLHHAHQACVLKLNVSWQQDNKACLYKKADPTPLLCANSISQQLQLELTEHTSFELRNSATGELLAERRVKVLQVDLNASDQLLKRSRNSWGNPLMQQILLIEDDLELSRLVVDFLQSEGYQVSSCGNALKAKKLILAQRFDLIVCDVMLPGSSGFDLVKQIRQQFKGPILFMTAQTSVGSVLQGLELGAQDYLLKPLDPRILLAKIRIFLPPEHASADPQPLLKQHNLTVDRVSGHVVLAGQDICLTNAELQLLLTLLDNYGVAVSRERLFREQLTREYDGTDRTMDGRASRLRRKFQNVDERWNVQVVWGQGYRISYAEATEPQP